MRVDIVGTHAGIVECGAYRPRHAGGTWRDHRLRFGRLTEAGQFRVDRSAARTRMGQRFEHEHARAGTEHEAVARDVVRTRGALGRRVESAREHAHRIEHQRRVVVQLFAAAGEHDLLPAASDQLHRLADRQRRCRASGRRRIADALQSEHMRHIRRHRAAHGLRNDERRRPLDTACGDELDCGVIGRQRPGPRADHRTGRGRAQRRGRQACIVDRHARRMAGEARRVAHEAFELARERSLAGERRRACDLARQASFGPRIDSCDTRAPGPQAIGHGVERIAEAGDDAHARDDDALRVGTLGGGHRQRLKISDVLMPPNAKLLLITYSASIERPSSTM